MLEFQEKRKLRRFLYSRVTLIILIVFIGVIFKAVWGVYEKQRTTVDNLNKTATSLEALQAREKMLSSEIERLKTKGGTEEEIREKYGLAKPGEEILVIVDNEGINSKAASSDVGFWQKVLNWLK